VDGFPQWVRGTAARQAHVGLPPGTVEEEHGRDGFYGPASHLYRTHAPTDWLAVEGPAAHRAYDLSGLTETGRWATPVLGNDDVAIGWLHLVAAPAELLRDAGQRYTAGRRRLVEALGSVDRPVTIAELLHREDDLAQSSAYRNLGVLEAAEVVHRVVSDDEFARYELAEDLTGHHHHHLICTTCGAVEDFTVPPDLEADLAAVSDRVAHETGFVARRHRLDLVGSCGTCR